MKNLIVEVKVCVRMSEEDYEPKLMEEDIREVLLGDGFNVTQVDVIEVKEE